MLERIVIYITLLLKQKLLDARVIKMNILPSKVYLGMKVLNRIEIRIKVSTWTGASRRIRRG